MAIVMKPTVNLKRKRSRGTILSMKTSGKTKRTYHWIWLLIAIFFTKELFWAYLTPPWQAPDEIAHFGYVESLFYEHTFPVLGENLLSRRVQAIGPREAATQVVTPGGVESQTKTGAYQPSLSLNWIAQHPPLYYLALQPVYWVLPHEDPLACIFVLRMLSILMGCVTLFYAWKTLRLLLPERDSPYNEIIQKTVIVGIAFLPMFSSISALMNNDNLVFMLSAMLIYLSVKNFGEHDSRGSMKMGILLGLLALTKGTALPLFLSIFLVEVIKHLRLKKFHGCFVKHQAVLFGAALVIAGWWYARNIALYGMFLPEIGSLAARNPQLAAAHPALLAMFPESGGTIALPNATLWDFFIGQRFLWEYYQNVWGAFGQFFFRLYGWQYFVITAITVASLCGYLALTIRKFRAKTAAKKNMSIEIREILSWPGWTMLLPILAVGAGLTYELFNVFRERGFLSALQGRYLFSALIPFMYFFVKGTAHLVTKKWLPIAMKLLMAFFVVNDAVTILYRIIPEFY